MALSIGILVPLALSIFDEGKNNLDPQNELVTRENNTRIVGTALHSEPIETQITTFQAGHGFKKMNPSGIQLDDSEDHVIGQQSLKLTTGGDGLAVFTRIIGISPPLDLDEKSMKVWVKVSDVSKIRELRVTVTGDKFETYRNYWISGPGVNSTDLKDNEWSVVTIRAENMRDVGAVDISRIDTIQLRVVDDGTGPVSVRFNGLATLEYSS